MYYKKVLVWTIVNSISTGIIIYVLDKSIANVVFGAMAQATVTLTLYSPYEYYCTWSIEPPCVILEERL